MKTCRGRLTTSIRLRWAGGWAVPHAAGACWCFAKAIMKPMHSRAFSWKDRGGQEIPTWVYSVVFSEQWCEVLKLALSHVCLPRENVNMKSKGFLFPNKASLNWIVSAYHFLPTAHLWSHISVIFWIVKILTIDSVLVCHLAIFVPFILIPLTKLTSNCSSCEDTYIILWKLACERTGLKDGSALLAVHLENIVNKSHLLISFFNNKSKCLSCLY